MGLPAARVGFCDGFFGDGKGAVLVGVFLGQLGAEVAGGGVDVDFALGEAAGKLGVAGLDGMGGIAGDDDDEVGIRQRRRVRGL